MTPELHTTELDTTETLRNGIAVDPDRLGRLRHRLSEVAEANDLLDVAYRVVDSPVGDLLLAATDIGLVRVAFADENHDDVLQALADRVSPRILHHRARLDPAARQLDEYFTGRLHTFAVPLDWQLSTGFRATVLHHLTDIEYGHTASYGDVARLAGRPNAFRAVGTACASNPLPVIVPCHRVVKSDGTMGGYLGGTDAKATLLALEAATSSSRSSW